ncbi:RimK family protein [Aestuariibacter salexigens]|uniref:RimK family protein n=1 Tax=Aestuariibacter salexigens TaxID=226010 RepID=UPI000411DF71|nr:RimK family protein [Aestuariibacter salexigens]
MLKTLLVVDDEAIPELTDTLDVIPFSQYLKDYPKRNEPRIRVINLCDASQYLSKGYYCSLLAEARNHLVLPSVKTINSLRDETQAQSMMNLPAKKLADGEYTCFAYFGHAADSQLQPIALQVFGQFSAPMLALKIVVEKSFARVEVRALSLAQLDDDQRAEFISQLAQFTDKQWRLGKSHKRYRWDMAILYDENEQSPPSDNEAIAKFVKAAAKHGILAKVCHVNDLHHLASFDALFIRQTTAIDHHTYRLACKAEQMGLVVVDDPSSILRCCNKVFLHDAFSYQKVPSLRTQVVDNANEFTVDALESSFDYPMILKLPEGSFSRGVYKVKDRNQLVEKLTEMLSHSALVLVQEYMFTEFDWRVGVFNQRALYACKYEMARNHWQIYNHDSKRFSSGGFETLPTFELPRFVLDAALKATKVVGDGLYGVDIKEKDGKAYVIEVNDNPSIDSKIEDAYLGNELYMQIMAEFHRRLELRGKT